VARASRIYCHPFEDDWPADAEVVEAVRSPRAVGEVRDRPGPGRPRLSRSQFVFTETRGRPAIFWQTRKTAQAANPGARIRAPGRSRAAWPSRSTRASGTRTVRGQDVVTERLALSPATTPSWPRATRSRASSARPWRTWRRRCRTARSRSSCSARRAPRRGGGRGGTLLGAVQARARLGRLARRHACSAAGAHPEVPVIFADSRRFAEEWTYRFLAAALSEAPPDPPGAATRS